MKLTISSIIKSKTYQSLQGQGYDIYLSQYPFVHDSPILIAMKRGNIETKITEVPVFSNFSLVEETFESLRESINLKEQKKR